MNTKKIIAIAAMTLVSVTGFAQMQTRLSIQPKFGLNVATMTDNEDCSNRIGITGGAEFEYMAKSNLSFTFGVLYSQEGLKGEVSGFDTNGDGLLSSDDEAINGTIKMDYINIPLLFNVYPIKGLAIKAGIQPGIKVNDKVCASYGDYSASIGLSEPLEKIGMNNVSVPSVVLSVPVGVSYEFSNIVLDARYNIGITNAMSAKYAGEEASSKNNYFSFTIGYKFAL